MFALLNKFVFLFLYLLGLSSFASDEKKIEVVTEYLEPYQFKKPDGSLSGFMTEVVEAIFEQAGYQPNIRVLPWARAIQTASAEKNVMIYSIVNTPERNANFHWIGAIPSEPLYLWGLKSKFPTPVTSLDALKSHSVSTLRRSNVDNYLSKKGFNVVGMSDQDLLLKMLSSERVGLTVASPASIKRRAEREGVALEELQRVIELKALNIDLSLAFGMKSDRDLVEAFQHAYNVLDDSGKLAEIRQKWYGK